MTPSETARSLKSEPEGLMKKLGMIIFSGLAALALIGTAALLMFGAGALLRATGLTH